VAAWLIRPAANESGATAPLGKCDKLMPHQRQVIVVVLGRDLAVLLLYFFGAAQASEQIAHPIANYPDHSTREKKWK
jgi:hypothetical protein